MATNPAAVRAAMFFVNQDGTPNYMQLGGAVSFPAVIGQSGVPVLLPPTTGTNTINTAGVITLTGITLPTQYASLWVYLMAGDVVGGLEGLYYAVQTSNTTNATIQVYTNYVAPTSVFTPFIPTSLVAAVGKNSALTSNTGADRNLATVTMPGGLMGANGTLRIENLLTGNNVATGARVNTIRHGALTNFSTSLLLATTSSEGRFFQTIRNRGDQSKQVSHHPATPAAGTFGSPAAYGLINTAVDQPISFLANLAVATDYIVLESFTVEVLPHS